MNYIEVEFILSNKTTDNIEQYSEVLQSDLCDIGFESFCNTDNGFLAYCQDNLFANEQMNRLVQMFKTNNPQISLTTNIRTIKQQDWNNEWEKDYEPVLVDNYCYVRAWFHKENSQAEYNIEITPQMSFGTAHHPTTYQIIQLLHSEDVKGKSVMDMGCGTGVLAILCAMKGAVNVQAIDIDEWAYNNALDNVKANEQPVQVKQGDASQIEGEYDIFIANINRNILLEDMPKYAQHINKDGVMFLSGFYEADVPLLLNEAAKWDFSLTNKVVKDDWVALRLVRQAK